MKIKNLQLRNVKCFSNKDISFLNHENNENNEPLSTCVLVGVNGAGKSTILKSIVNVLTSLNPIYGGELFDINSINLNGDFMQISLEIAFNEQESYDLIGKKEIINEEFIVLYAKQDLSIQSALIYPNKYDDDKKREYYVQFIKQFISNNFKGGRIIYFDTFRFLPQIKIEGPSLETNNSNIKANTLSNSILNNNILNNKFQYVKQWLVNLDYKRLKDSSGKYDQILNQVINALNVLYNPYGFKKITENGDVIFDIKGEDISIDKLSDGFKSLFIILGEILYRFSSEDGSSENFLKMEAVILIDEIDCHLHPKWQLNILPSLKKLLPNCQFIVTTHSPFIIQSVQPYEIIKIGDEEVWEE
ncbi:MAG: ATPase [Clostridiaceae bacterium]|jgi:predicted ATP-binding protein involved in virulence|nr:ATPase [Clostridiaceae bacterium]